ncbi:MAG: hypothetical protein DWQ49_09425 [Bacteroidetes bacterium]|mgnify:CR=1 FL=1|nr:MAG: hypothetical protein DWQ49_09425 [Bacteroidota bacterium]
MPAQYKAITRGEMTNFLEGMGFEELDRANSIDPKLRGVKERVFSKTVGKNVRLRVFTGIEGEGSRKCGKDAIRCRFFGATRNKNGKVTIAPLGGAKRVHRVMGWKDNLTNRLDEMSQKIPQMVPCPICGSIMVRREGKHFDAFLGCSQFPNCKGTREISE